MHLHILKAGGGVRGRLWRILASLDGDVGIGGRGGGVHLTAGDGVSAGRATTRSSMRRSLFLGLRKSMSLEKGGILGLQKDMLSGSCYPPSRGCLPRLCENIRYWTLIEKFCGSRVLVNVL